MLDYAEGTPCPIGGIKDPQGALREDVTDELNYTTEFKARLRNGGPRRRTFAATRDENMAETRNVLATINAASMTSDGKCKKSASYKRKGLEMPLPRRQPSNPTMQRIGETGGSREELSGTLVRSEAPNMRKRPRRRTIYIPSDDTTILTVHPGKQLDSTLLSGDSSRNDFHLPMEITSIDGIENEKRCSRRLSLAAAPRRNPLQPTLKPLQEIDDKHNSFIIGPGKENVPPKLLELSGCDKRGDAISKARRVSILKAIPKHRSKPQEPHIRQWSCGEVVGRYAEAEKSVESQRQPGMSQSTILTTPALYKDRRVSMMNRRNSLYYGTSWKVTSNMTTSQEQMAPSEKIPAAAILQKNVKIMTQYQFLEEDIERPEMYEDLWLSHQECALQQLLNVVFERAHEKTMAQQCDRRTFRGELLRLYQDPHNALIYKRLHASLLYGALKPPKGSIASTNRLKTDVGLRHDFSAIWLGTYELEALASAAETVVGRKISVSSSSPKSSLPRSYEEPLKERKRSITLFIESCLLRNEDACEQSHQSNPIWCWRRTMLRCLMMVLLLEKAKEGGMWPMNLFQSSSKLKSSGDVVSGILSLISPFLGDGTRTLSHLQYQVHHFQSPLSEFKYSIENFATDFRDGVRLTRLVELLLYQPQTCPGFRKDNTTDTMLSDGFSSTSEQHIQWPLSQKLHLPCSMPTQKGHNVRIALDALNRVGGAVENIAEGVNAEDIVNGHREKTVALLWTLLGARNLELLINPEEIHREIRRLSKRAVGTKDRSIETEDDSKVILKRMTRHTHLLQQWATASARCQGVQVSNLTTSFSDGRAFAAIVDEYQNYLPKAHLARCSGAVELEAKLKNLGCSSAFARIFAHREQGRVFDRKFTLAALIFLYSRLMSATKRGIAASVIFRAYQQAKIRRNLRSEAIASRLSHDHQSAYITQNRELAAVRVLQRQWRAYVGQKKCGRTLPQRHGKAARKRVVQTEWETSHDNVDIWLF